MTPGSLRERRREGAQDGRRPRPRSLLLLAALLVALGLLTSGGLSCASYTTRLHALRAAVVSGELEQALALVEKESDPGDLLHHLEKGTILHHLGRFAESNAELEQAEEVFAERYTISLSQRGLTFLTSDEVEPYAGEAHERNYLHYYRLLNFLSLGDRTGAAVEARRLALRLSELGDRSKGDLDEHADPFLEYVSGVVLESIGEWNSALVAYRRAAEIYAEWPPEIGLSAPPWLTADILRSARRSGIDPREIGFDDAVPPPAPSEGAQLVVFCGQGWTPKKTSEHLRVPIFTVDLDEDGEDAALATGQVVANRYHYYRTHGSWSEESLELSYYLDVAIPVLNPPVACEVERIHVRVRGMDADDPSGFAKTVSAVPGSDLQALVERTFARHELAVLAKTFARALLKYAAHRQAKTEWGPLAGILVNLAGAATEKADTRAWLLLPGEIRIARIDLPAGRYRVELDALDAQGGVLEGAVREVELAPGEIRILSWRSFS